MGKINRPSTWQCPKCDYKDFFLIFGEAMLEVGKHGVRYANDPQAEWWNDTWCQCPHCHFEGEVRDFF